MLWVDPLEKLELERSSVILNGQKSLKCVYILIEKIKIHLKEHWLRSNPRENITLEIMLLLPHPLDDLDEFFMSIEIVCPYSNSLVRKSLLRRGSLREWLGEECIHEVSVGTLPQFLGLVFRALSLEIDLAIYVASVEKAV